MAAWTPERDALALRLRAGGLSSSEIARELGGFSHCEDGGRHAVVGRLWRLTLTPEKLEKRQKRQREYYHTKLKPKRPRKDLPVTDELGLYAAAIVADGGSYAEAMEETGLTRKEVSRAVTASRCRENKEIKARASETLTTAWGTLGRERDHAR